MANSPCVLGLREGKSLVFYSLDPVRGKGILLGKIEVNQTDEFMGWDVSPDGSSLALVDVEKYGGRIEVLTLFDRKWSQVFLEPEGQHPATIAWAADGKGFFVTTSEPYGLLHVSLTGQVHSLFSSGHSQWFQDPSPSPDGKYLAFSAQTNDSNVWLLENF
jgi:Tol biopolymer transport system component